MKLNEFLEKFLPNYYKRDYVARLDDLHKYLVDEMEMREEVQKDLYEANKRNIMMEFSTLQDKLFSEAFQNFQTTMEQILEFKDISGYLPYRLKVISLKPTNKTIGELCVKYGGMNCVQVYSSDFEDKNDYLLHLSDIKPILLPLSDLYKTIQHNGKEIVPIVELAKLSGITDCLKLLNCGHLRSYRHSHIDEPDEYTFSFVLGHFEKTYYGKKVGIENEYLLFDYLNELKIDYRGLIDAGLAVDVNTIDINHYK